MLHCAAVKQFNHNRLKPLAVLIIIGLMLTINAFAVPKVQAQDPATEIFQLVNNFRISLGLPPFRWNNQLAAASQTQANWMVANPNSFVHTWPDGTTKEDRARAAGYNGRVVENIVGGWDMSPKRALNWWQNSPVHYNTITSSFYVDAGTAYAGSGRQGRYVIVVGNQGSAPARPSSREPESVPIIVEPIVLVEPDEDGEIIHIAGQGHALWTLAAYYDVKVADLLLYNDMQENDLVSVGDEIVIQPARDWVPPPTPTPPYSVFVGKGQTLWTIAAIHQVDLADILLFNGLSADAFISEGDEIKIRLRPGEQPPTPTPTPTPIQKYIVRQGDSAWSISARFGITLEQLLAWNELPQNPLLSVGQELWVIAPASGDSVSGEPFVAAADLVAELTPAPETAEEQSAEAVTVQLPTVVSIKSATPELSATAAPTQSAEPVEIALAADDGSNDQPKADNSTGEEVEVVSVGERPQTILNLPLILGILAAIFLGIGAWLFLESRKVE